MSEILKTGLVVDIFNDIGLLYGDWNNLQIIDKFSSSSSCL